jgi:hypothetical protein
MVGRGQNTKVCVCEIERIKKFEFWPVPAIPTFILLLWDTVGGQWGLVCIVWFHWVVSGYHWVSLGIIALLMLCIINGFHRQPIGCPRPAYPEEFSFLQDCKITIALNAIQKVLMNLLVFILLVFNLFRKYYFF